MNTRTLITMAVLFTAAARQELAAGADPTPRELHAVVYNYANADPETVSRAMREAARILGYIGVRLSWRPAVVVPADTPAEPLSTINAFIRILPEGMAGSLPVRQDAYGCAPAARLVNAFYDRIEQLTAADGHRIALSKFLGHVIAHELGHLLLGHNAHGREGIMQADWQSNYGWSEKINQGWLLFTSDEGRRIRGALTGIR